MICSRSSISIVLALVAFLETGCVRRRLFVNSNPAGALVYVDNEQIGTTPCAVDFTYYGTREIRLVKPGYETLTLNQPIPTPWYQIPPLDFFSENLVPYKIRDNRAVAYNLSPQILTSPQELIGRGEQLRQQTLQGAVLPASASTPIIPPGAVPVGPAVQTGPSATQPPAGANPGPLMLPGPPTFSPPPPSPNSTGIPSVLGPVPSPTVAPGPSRPIVSPPLR